ncbi:MAG: ComF family protein [Candidatus Binatia bacterium]
MRHLWDLALSLLYPASCCGCGQPLSQPHFCMRCQGEMRPPRPPLCVVCGAPFGTAGDRDHRCGRCLAAPPSFGRARACTVYAAADRADHPLKAALQRYKYAPDVSLARPLGRLLAERCPLALRDYSVVMPVPLHVSRLRWRGFNQALLLTRSLVRRAGVPMDPFSLERVRPTRPQVELDHTERQRNVRHAFQVRRPARVRGQRILLVDDVYTTGATADACSRALMRAGATTVDVLTLARAVAQ